MSAPENSSLVITNSSKLTSSDRVIRDVWICMWVQHHIITLAAPMKTIGEELGAHICIHTQSAHFSPVSIAVQTSAAWETKQQSNTEQSRTQEPLNHISWTVKCCMQESTTQTLQHKYKCRTNRICFHTHCTTTKFLRMQYNDLENSPLRLNVWQWEFNLTINSAGPQQSWI
jgi:hypothetical protein